MENELRADMLDYFSGLRKRLMKEMRNAEPIA